VGYATVATGAVKGIQNDSNYFKRFQNHSSFIRSKKDLPDLKKFEIKYGFEVFDEKNNFTYRNVSRFELDFE
jgi:hypothetical protein